MLWQPPSNHTVAPESVSPDGRFVYYTAIDAGQAGIWVLDVEAGATRPVASLNAPGANEGSPIVHPSGRFLGYVSDETGRPEVYVRELADDGTVGRRWTISVEGGDEPRWSRDGEVIYYRTYERFLAVDVDAAGPDLAPSSPRVVIESLIVEPPGARTEYDISGDGRILVAGLAGIDVSLFSRIHVVVNWFEELERLSTARR